MTLTGIGPATFRLVAQRLNELRYRVSPPPNNGYNTDISKDIRINI
jgi:hypothetical protein